MFELYYKKGKNASLFEYLEKNGFIDTQNYNPLYSRFFSLDQNNYNSINLNQRYRITTILKRISNNKFNIKCLDKNDNVNHKNSFFKFSPLLDPVKFMVGKYKLKDNSIKEIMPKLLSKNGHKKVLDKNNSAYVDSFFSYLSSQLKNTTNYDHGIDFYGSFLSVQEKFIFNIYDDIEYLHDSEYFHKNVDTLFELDDFDKSKHLEGDTRNYREKIILKDETPDLEIDTIDTNLFKGIFRLTHENLEKHNSVLQEEFSCDIKDAKEKSLKKTNSTCSSRSSNTEGSVNESEVSDDDSESSNLESCSNSQMSDYSTIDDDEVINATVFKFPVQIICLEQLENTLDSLMEEEELTNKEWTSCLFQIIMMLITYQKVFDFTHNDLHTNNIMWTKTDKKFLNYKYNSVYYRVPTYGKLFKIIDFGRAVYKFKGKTICSDSYHPEGDAATQFNFEPYFNEKKPRLIPNKSFDLCRLGCSLFDYFIEKEEDEKNIKDPIAKIVDEWIRDDKNRNILYKNNGEERYPDFKLYKMIVRTVHNHLPEKQLEKEIFKQYISSRKKIKKSKVINIDKMETMV